MRLTDLAGTAAVVSSLFFVWPQVVQLVRTRDTNGISAVGALWPMAGFALWSEYGLDRHLYPVVAANAQAFIGFAIILFLRLKWGEAARGFAVPALSASVAVVVVGTTAPASLWIAYGVLKRDALIVAPNLLIVPTAVVIAVRAGRAQLPGAAVQTTSASYPS